MWDKSLAGFWIKVGNNTPRFLSNTSLSATLTAQPSPRGLPVGACHTTVGAFRVAVLLIFHTCQRHYPGGNAPVPVSLTSRRVLGLLLNCDRIDSRIKCFETCSTFTRVPARMVAELPNATLLPEVLQSMSLPP